MATTTFHLLPVAARTGQISQTGTVPAGQNKTLSLQCVGIPQTDWQDTTKGLLLQLFVQQPDTTFKLDAGATYPFGNITLENGQTQPDFRFVIYSSGYAGKTVKGVISVGHPSTTNGFTTVIPDTTTVVTYGLDLTIE